MRGANAKRFSGDAPPVVALFSCFLVGLRGLGRVLVSAPEARSAEGDGRRQPPVSAAADLYQDKHTPNCHLPFFLCLSCFSGLYFCAAFRMKKGSIAAAFGRWFCLRFDDVFTVGQKAVRGNLRVFRQSRKSNVPTPSRNCRFPFRTGLAR